MLTKVAVIKILYETSLQTNIKMLNELKRASAQYNHLNFNWNTQISQFSALPDWKGT